MISRRDIGEDDASLLLLEQNKHKPMYPYAWPWHIIAHHLFPYIANANLLFIFYIVFICKYLYYKINDEALPNVASVVPGMFETILLKHSTKLVISDEKFRKIMVIKKF